MQQIYDDDPEHGFAILQRREYAKLEEAWASGDQGWHHERNYVETLVIYDQINSLGFLTDFYEIPTEDSRFSEFFSRFRVNASFKAKRLLAEYASRVKFTENSIVELDQSAKEAIHSFVASIRERLSELSINEDKRLKLLKRLYAFELELDLARTRTEAFYQFTIDMNRCCREANSELQPILKSADRVFDMIDKAKKLFESLPPWREKKQITGPKQRDENSLKDDEIPF